MTNINRREFLKLSGLFGALLTIPARVLQTVSVKCRRVGNAWFPETNGQFWEACDCALPGDIIWLDPLPPRHFESPNITIRNPIVLGSGCSLSGRIHVYSDPERNPNELPMITVMGEGA